MFPAMERIAAGNNEALQLAIISAARAIHVCYATRVPRSTILEWLHGKVKHKVEEESLSDGVALARAIAIVWGDILAFTEHQSQIVLKYCELLKGADGDPDEATIENVMGCVMGWPLLIDERARDARMPVYKEAPEAESAITVPCNLEDADIETGETEAAPWLLALRNAQIAERVDGYHADTGARRIGGWSYKGTIGLDGIAHTESVDRGERENISSAKFDPDLVAGLKTLDATLSAVMTVRSPEMARVQSESAAEAARRNAEEE